MKVLFVASLYHPYNGGAERILRMVAEGIVKAGHQAVVVCASNERDCVTREVNGVKVYYLAIKNVYWPFDGYRPHATVRAIWAAIEMYNIYAGRAVGRILDIEQPSLVNTHNLTGFSASVWSEVKWRRLPLLHTLHDYWLLCGKSSMYRWGEVCKTPCLMCRIYCAPRRWLSGKVNAVSADGNFVLQKHLDLGLFGDGQATRGMHTASNVEIGVQPQPTATPGHLRLGYLGRIEPFKGVEALREALATIPAGWELQLAGGGYQDYIDQFKARFRSDKVKFLGVVQPKDLFANIDVLLVPSVWNDPLPTVIFEAYAHGIPVIGSSRGGIPELIEEGQTGFVFFHEVPGSLAGVIRRFIDDPRLAASMRAKVLAKARHYSPERLADEYLALFAQVLKSN